MYSDVQEVLRVYAEEYISGLVLLSVYCAVKDSSGHPKWLPLKNAVLNIAVIGLFALIIISVFFWPMLIRTLGTNYSQAYSAYDAPLKQKILAVFKAYSYLSFIIAGIGVILSLARRTMRRYACFRAVYLIVSPVTFFHVQAVGIHHLYIITVQLFILQSIGVTRRRIVSALSVLVLCAGFANCFVPSVRPFLSPAGKLFSDTYDLILLCAMIFLK